MELNKDIKLFKKFGFTFYDFVGDKSIEEIFKWIKEIIQLENDQHSLNHYQKMAKAILNIKDYMPDDKLNTILEYEFGLFADPVLPEKAYVKNFQNYIGNNRVFLQKYADAISEGIEKANEKIQTS